MERTRIVRPPEEPQAPAKSKYSELVDIDKTSNSGLKSAPASFVHKLLGPPTSKEVLNLTHFSADVGPFNVDALYVAANSVREVMSTVKSKYPELYTRLTHQGMRVVKNISDSKSSSLHSWGIAIDIKVDKVKDVRFNDKALLGLNLIAPIFHEHGWYWGGAFSDKKIKQGSCVYWSNEDAMHFEVSKNALLAWDKAGLLRKKGVFPVGVLAIQKQKPSQAPLEPKKLPPNSFFKAPLPRRPSESWPNWFGRKTKSWARTTGTWFR